MIAIFRFFVASAAFFFLAAPASADQCRVGSRVTLTKQLDTELNVKGNEWHDLGMGLEPCMVALIVGKGRPPANCSEGSTLIATGVVRRRNVVVLDVTSARCEDR